MNGCRKSVVTAVCGVSILATSALAVTKNKFDFIVGVDGDFKAAMAAAAKGASATNRFVIFFPEAEYNIGTLTGDANQKTTFTTSNVSFIGQSEDKTIVFNKSTNEGISITATLFFNNANDLYFQDLTIMNRSNYGNTATYNVTGRHVAVQEQGNKYVYKNVRLLSTQDTYYTKGKRTYWESGQIHGTTDFICGEGDVFFNGVLLYEMKKSAIAAPSTTTTWGYVFKDCIIDGTVSDFTLARSWNTGKAVFLNTTMKKLPSAAGWGDPMNSNPQLFAEYKSVNASGALIDLSQRRKSYTSGTTVTLNPVLTDAEAAKYTVGNVLGGSDNWQPQTLTKQVPAPVVTMTNGKLAWDDNVDALCWVVFKNGKYLANVTTNGYDLSSVASGDLLTVRAANAMGGLGAPSNAVKAGAVTGMAPKAFRKITELKSDRAVVELTGFGAVRVGFTLSNAKGEVIYRSTLVVDEAQLKVDLSPLRLPPGFYLATASASGFPAKAFSLRIVE